MLTRSAKAKGKRLERWVCSTIRSILPILSEDDCRITVGSETGADIKLSRRALEVFPYAVECKNRETFGTLYKYVAQAQNNKIHQDQLPVVFIKSNNKTPLALIEAEHFFELIKDKNAGK